MVCQTAVQYRPEIDGLRAVAVSSVVLFHAGVAGVEGGFVGVDIFLVISGYLITRLILADLNAGAFSIVDFWERRARRLLPAMLTVVASCLAVGWFLLGPEDYRRLTQEAAAQSLFLSNIVFWLKSGYFDAAAKSRVLLHTWSLSLEEQFYLLFPWILLFLKSWRLAVGIVCVAGLILLSLLVSEAMLEIDVSFSFYLLPSRMWELLLGALVAFVPPIRMSRATREVLSAAGLGAIGFAILKFSETMSFPGYNALLPSAGAALFIGANRERMTSSGNLLALPLLVSLGLISYAVYLWHWPIIVFLNATGSSADTVEGQLGVCAASVFMGWLSWRLVEMPVRRRRVLASKRAIFGVSASAIAAAVTFGALGHLTQGFRQRLNAQQLALADAAQSVDPRRVLCHGLAPEAIAADRICVIGEKLDRNVDTLIWGDSHADALLSALSDAALAAGKGAWHATQSTCPPLLGVSMTGLSYTSRCRDFNDSMIDFVLRKGVRRIVLVARWTFYAGGGGPLDARGLAVSDGLSDGSSLAEVVSRRLIATVAKLREAGAEIWIVKEVPVQSFDPPSVLVSASLRGIGLETVGSDYADHVRRSEPMDAVFSLLGSSGIHIVDPASILCASGKVCKVYMDGKAVYRDFNHLSVEGARLIEPLLDSIFTTN